MPIIQLRDLDRLGEDARLQIRAALDADADADPQPPSSTAIEILPANPSKMHNIRTSIDGYNFDSLSEARRYGELKIEAMAGYITDLQVHPRFGLDVNGVHICDYEADFTYHRGRQFIVEDVKTTATVTRLYRVKKKLMLAVRGIKIHEVYGV
jgi:hypothetical protein